MPRTGDWTSMWWAEGFPGVVDGAPWLRCIQTGRYMMVLDTESMRVPHFGHILPGSGYAMAMRGDRELWRAFDPAELDLTLAVDGKVYRCTEGGKWSRFTGPRLIESGRFLQRADVTGLVFRADDGEPLNVEARFETSAWARRLGLILAARPGVNPIPAGDTCFGKIGGGFGLDGTNHLEIPHAPEFDPANFTIDLWAFVPTRYQAGRTSPWLFCKNRNEAHPGNIGIVIRNGKPEARMNIGGGRDGQFTAAAARALKFDSWNHLAVSYDGTTLRLYLNGSEAGSRKVGRKRIPGRDGIAIGRRQDNNGDGYHFRGAVDEIRIHDRALKPDEIRRSFRDPSKTTTKPVRTWSFRPDGKASEEPPRARWANASMGIRFKAGLDEWQGTWRLPADHVWNSPDWKEVHLAVDLGRAGTQSEPCPVIVRATNVPDGTARPVEFSPSRGWHRINIDRIKTAAPPAGRDPKNDAMERVRLVLTNPTANEQTARLMFEKSRGGFSVTGMSAILRTPDGQPTGIPVQLSKNWHNDPRAGVHSGAWFHGISQVRLPPNSTTELELSIVYGHWGGVAAASHAQLCLIGWGSNQRWDESALGSWGESICYEPSTAQAHASILDVRPAMVGLKDGKPSWNWTSNVGGGDWFRLFDESGKRVPPAGMRAVYHRYGPCLTEVTYAGRFGKPPLSRIAHSVTASLGRTDDIVRGTYRLRLDVETSTEISRLAIFQVGADTYNFTREDKLAIGDESGLRKEWAPTRGGDVYRTQPVECTGRIPWMSLHEGRPRSENDIKGAWANRGIVIRRWEARLGGKKATPWVAEHGTSARGGKSSTLDIVPPPGVTRLERGDFVDATIEYVVMPQSARDYYGPNQALRAALAKHGNTWQMIHREALGNDRKVTMQHGTLERTFPDIRVDTGTTSAAFSLSGGLGSVPVTFAGLSSPGGHTLLMDGRPVKQSTHGNDFWQTDYDPATKRWSQTYNVATTPGTTHTLKLITTP